MKNVDETLHARGKYRARRVWVLRECNGGEDG